MTTSATGSFSAIFGESESRVMSHQVIAEKLIQEGFILTALEYHAELLESGQELKYLKEYFENSQNFSCTEDVVGQLKECRPFIRHVSGLCAHEHGRGRDQRVDRVREECRFC